MYLMYLDDSGSAKNTSESHLVLGGIVLHESKTFWINKKMDDLAASIYPSDPSSIEFHASEIFGGRKAPWNGMSKTKRIEVIKAVLDIARQEQKNTAVFACAVHKESYKNHDPLELAFENLCSRFDLFISRIYHENNERHAGLIILDESSHETSLQQLAINFRKVGTKWRVTKNLQEVPLFVDSRASRSIQLADHIAYAVFRRYEAKDLNYYDVIESCFDADEERIHGLIHKTSSLSCTCPSCLLRRMPGRHEPSEVREEPT